MLRPITGSEYLIFQKNGTLDAISQARIGNIPRERVVMDGLVPYDVYSLRQLLEHDISTNPFTGTKLNMKNQGFIRNRAAQMGWTPHSWNTNNAKYTSSMDARTSTKIRKQFDQHQLALIKRRLRKHDGRPPATLRRIASIAKKLLTDPNKKQNMYRFPEQGVRIRFKGDTCVDCIEIQWTKKRSSMINKKGSPVVLLRSPSKYHHDSNSFIPVACIDRNILFHQAQDYEWTIVMDRDIQSATVPGSRNVTYLQATKALVSSLGFRYSLGQPLDLALAFTKYMQAYDGDLFTFNHPYVNLLQRLGVGDSEYASLNRALEQSPATTTYANALTHLLYKFPIWATTSQYARTQNSLRKAFRNLEEVGVSNITIGRRTFDALNLTVAAPQLKESRQIKRVLSTAMALGAERKNADSPMHFDASYVFRLDGRNRKLVMRVTVNYSGELQAISARNV